jgi:hypothetical protein
MINYLKILSQNFQFYRQKKLVLIGPVGSGKSTTGCILLRNKPNRFTTGKQSIPVTIEFQAENDNLLHVVDTSGLSDQTNSDIFQNNFLKYKEEFLKILPIDAFILVIKFDGKEFKGFFTASQEYFRYFGSIGIKSLLILFIQEGEEITYSEKTFLDIISKSDGYRFLKVKNNDQRIPFCLWDNKSSIYYDMQQNELLNQVAKLEKIDFNKFIAFCDMLENDIRRIIELKRKDKKIDEFNKQKNKNITNTTRCK